MERLLGVIHRIGEIIIGLAFIIGVNVVTYYNQITSISILETIFVISGMVIVVALLLSLWRYIIYGDE